MKLRKKLQHDFGGQVEKHLKELAESIALLDIIIAKGAISDQHSLELCRWIKEYQLIFEAEGINLNEYKKTVMERSKD